MGTKQIQVSSKLWQQMCTVGWRGTLECTEGLPEGAVFCGVSYIFPEFRLPSVGAPPPSLVEYMKFSQHIIALIFEHPDWPEIEPGEDTPVLRVGFRETYSDPEL